MFFPRKYAELLIEGSLRAIVKIFSKKFS